MKVWHLIAISVVLVIALILAFGACWQYALNSWLVFEEPPEEEPNEDTGEGTESDSGADILGEED